MKKLAIYLVTALGLIAQYQNDTSATPRFTIYKETSLSSSAEVITFFRYLSGAKSADMESAYVYCSVACTITLEIGGTFTTGTAITAIPGWSRWGTATIAAFHTASISSTSTVMKYYISAGGSQVIDLNGIYLGTPGNAFTIRTNSITGTVVISGKWKERN